MKKSFSLLCSLMIFSIVNISSQDVPNSLGTATYANNTAQPSIVFDAAVGTRYFIHISSSPTFQFGKSFLEGCTITNIGVSVPITFPGGLFYRNGTVYTWNQSAPYQIWSIDTVSGVNTLIVAGLAGVPQANLTGITWDGTTLYGVSTSITASQIFSINGSVCTPIGTPSTVCAGAIFLAGRSLNTGCGLYSVDIVADNFYRWNKTTGVATLIGPLGVNANFGQDAQFDNSDGSLYWAAYTTGPELRRLDTSGSSIQLCTYPAQATGIAPIYAPAPPAGIYTEFCRTGLNIIIPNLVLVRDSVLVPNQGLGCLVTDVNYKIVNITHTWDSDLRIYAQHLTTGSLIVNHVGGSGDNFVNTVLNDSGTVPIASGTPPFTGTFIPSNPLTGFIGQNPDGYWKILITDTASGDTGILTGWCIQLTRTCPVGGIQNVEIPNYYSLSQNYPNPFNPATVIKFTLPESQNVKLAVYDILGREVKTLVNEFKNSGVYEINFSTAELSSGTYFYRLITDNFTETKKMLMIK